MTKHPTPTKAGFYWAKWRLADPATDECQACGHKHSEWEDEAPISLTNWEPVEVFDNCFDETQGELLRVSVCGVNRSQSVENFVWGPAIAEFTA